MKPIKVEDLFVIPMAIFYILAAFVSDLIMLVSAVLIDLMSVLTKHILVPINRTCSRMGEQIGAKQNGYQANSR